MKLIKQLILLLTFVCIAVLVSGCANPFGSFSNKKDETPKNVNYMEVKAEDLINDYASDANSAQNKYKNKNVRISGKLIRKGQFTNNNNFYAVIADRHASGRNYSVLVEYPAEMVEEINKYKQNDFVVAQGACLGLVPQDNPNAICMQVYAGKVVEEIAQQPANTDSNVNGNANANANSVMPEQTAQRTGTITGTEVRIRAGASKTSQILGYYEKGEVVTILEIAQQWTKVMRGNGQIGWVSNDYCRIN